MGAFQAMLMKLSPARRVLLLVAVVLLLFNPDFRFGNGQIDLGFAWLGTAHSLRAAALWNWAIASP